MTGTKVTDSAGVPIQCMEFKTERDGPMKFIIVGKNIDVTPGLKAAVEDKIGKLEKYLSTTGRSCGSSKSLLIHVMDAISTGRFARKRPY